MAEDLRCYVDANQNLSIKMLFKGLCKVKGIEKFGATVFVGRIDTNQSLLHYICVGDIKALQFTSSSVKQLKTQQGVLCFTSPESIKEYVVSLNQGDGIAVSSDGVASFEKVLTASSSKASAEQMCEQIM